MKYLCKLNERVGSILFTTNFISSLKMYELGTDPFEIHFYSITFYCDNFLKHYLHLKFVFKDFKLVNTDVESWLITSQKQSVLLHKFFCSAVQKKTKRKLNGR